MSFMQVMNPHMKKSSVSAANAGCRGLGAESGREVIAEGGAAAAAADMAIYLVE
jgi:hypothetical protein